MCAVTNAVLYVTVCVISEPRSSVKCILLSFFISDTIPSHFYAINFHVCFVFCSCHLLWFPQLLNLLGITHSRLGVFLIENPAVLWLGLKHFLPSAKVSVEFPCCWQVLCCRGTPPRAAQRDGDQVDGKAFHRAALLNPELCFFSSFCPLSFFLLSLVLSSSLLRKNLCILWLLGLWFSWTRQDKARSFSSFLLRLWRMPKLPCWDMHYPSTKPSCNYRTNNTVIMTNTFCHHTQARQAWSESQKNLTDFTCFGLKKIKLRNAAFLLPSHLWQRGFTPPPYYDSPFWWFSISFFEQLSVS